MARFRTLLVCMHFTADMQLSGAVPRALDPTMDVQCCGFGLNISYQ